MTSEKKPTDFKGIEKIKQVYGNKDESVLYLRECDVLYRLQNRIDELRKKQRKITNPHRIKISGHGGTKVITQLEQLDKFTLLEGEIKGLKELKRSLEE